MAADLQALNVNPCEEGDPIFTCNFKTEMMCALLTITGGNLAVNIGPTYVPSILCLLAETELQLTCRIEYLKKKDKKASIKAVKNEAVRGDATYKSSTISVATGAAANSGTSISTLLTACSTVTDQVVSAPQPPRMPKRKKAAKAAPAGMAVSSPTLPS